MAFFTVVWAVILCNFSLHSPFPLNSFSNKRVGRVLKHPVVPACHCHDDKAGTNVSRNVSCFEMKKLSYEADSSNLKIVHLPWNVSSKLNKALYGESKHVCLPKTSTVGFLWDQAFMHL